MCRQHTEVARNLGLTELAVPFPTRPCHPYCNTSGLLVGITADGTLVLWCSSCERTEPYPYTNYCPNCHCDMTRTAAHNHLVVNGSLRCPHYTTAVEAVPSPIVIPSPIAA